MKEIEKEALRKILVALFLEHPRRTTTQARGEGQQKAIKPSPNSQSAQAPEIEGETTHGR